MPKRSASKRKSRSPPRKIMFTMNSVQYYIVHSLGVVRRKSDDKYCGRLRKTSKGVYMMKAGHRHYLPARVANRL